LVTAYPRPKGSSDVLHTVKSPVLIALQIYEWPGFRIPQTMRRLVASTTDKKAEPFPHLMAKYIGISVCHETRFIYFRLLLHHLTSSLAIYIELRFIHGMRLIVLAKPKYR
jgi:hypothetical protein